MKATLTKRATAYLIDIIIVIVVLGIVSLIYHPDTNVLQKEIDLVTVDYAYGDLSFSNYIKEISSLYKQVDMTNIFLNIINVLVIILYFVIIPYFNKGKTIGKHFMHIFVRKSSNKTLDIVSLFIRNLLINGLFYLILIIVSCLIIPDDYYFIVITGLGIIQISLLLVSVIMVLYRKDRKGLHDLLAGTYVGSSR